MFVSCRSPLNLFATLCTQKGPKDTYAVVAFASWIWEIGHIRLIIQSDGEPDILALVAAVRDKIITDGRTEQITCRVSPKGSHESNGAEERTVQQVRDMARVYLEHVREKTGSEFPQKSPWWAWHCVPRSDSEHTLNLRYRLESWFRQDGLDHICRKVRHSLCAVAGWAETLTLTNTLLEVKLGFSARERTGD